jgi:hypothetical protein
MLEMFDLNAVLLTLTIMSLSQLVIVIPRVMVLLIFL